ncbi:MAG: asparagine synthase (glutamine-hydrolyzing) [Nitrospinae bacterium]|nr:asparagine synthase (glutamine-hydrolyzing) [Nitrospinota bacterium]
MCGICGAVNLDGSPANRESVLAMTRAIAHRGPDGEGIAMLGPIGLGHRRLAIIDVSSAASQPMATGDGGLTISYNGEIYNFMELRKELEGLGHRFHSRSDTEVVLHSYAQWGKEALGKFNGMFALSIWDAKNKELFLARDRYGMKPLYYLQSGGQFLFGSEIKAILAHGSYQTQLDKEALLEYFTFQNIFTDKTFFKDVKMLPAASHMTINAGNGTAGPPVQYWDYDFTEPEKPVNADECVARLDFLFRQAVHRQLVSDVDLGSYLSGGLDSGSITAVAAKSLPYIKTFTVGFDLTSASGMEMGFDERAKAEYMSYLFKTEHYEMVLKSGDMERVIGAVTGSLEYPRVGQSYPNYCAARLASRFCKVILSGAGGDEMFGGYPWRYYRAAVNGNFESYVDKYYAFWQRLIPDDDTRDRIFAPVWSDVKHVRTRDIFRKMFNGHVKKINTAEDYINHSLYFEAKTFLHGLFMVEDKLSMAHGLETRAPFMDNDLVDFAMKTPVKMKLGNLGEVARLNENEFGPKAARYFEKTRDGKLVLRRMMERYIPEEVTTRIKQGFTAPDASWFKGESIDYVRRILYNDNARIYEYMDRKTVLGLVDGHLEGRTNRRLLIWSLISFEEWLKRFA